MTDKNIHRRLKDGCVVGNTRLASISIDKEHISVLLNESLVIESLGIDIRKARVCSKNKEIASGKKRSIQIRKSADAFKFFLRERGALAIRTMIKNVQPKC